MRVRRTDRKVVGEPDVFCLHGGEDRVTVGSVFWVQTLWGEKKDVFTFWAQRHLFFIRR